MAYIQQGAVAAEAAAADVAMAVPLPLKRVKRTEHSNIWRQPSTSDWWQPSVWVTRSNLIYGLGLSATAFHGIGFGAWGLGFRVSGLGFWVKTAIMISFGFNQSPRRRRQDCE